MYVSQRQALNNILHRQLVLQVLCIGGAWSAANDSNTENNLVGED